MSFVRVEYARIFDSNCYNWPRIAGGGQAQLFSLLSNMVAFVLFSWVEEDEGGGARSWRRKECSTGDVNELHQGWHTLHSTHGLCLNYRGFKGTRTALPIINIYRVAGRTEGPNAGDDLQCVPCRLRKCEEGCR